MKKAIRKVDATFEKSGLKLKLTAEVKPNKLKPEITAEAQKSRKEKLKNFNKSRVEFELKLV